MLALFETKELLFLFISRTEQRQLAQEHTERFVEFQPNEFSIIPDQIIFTDKLTDGEKMFLFKLFAVSSKKKGLLYHSNDTLAEEFGCSVSNVTKHLRLLKKKKAIEILSVGTFKARIICLTPWNLL